MFRTRIAEATEEPTGFLWPYKLAVWGCGFACAAGAVIDLQSGDVHAAPLCGKREGR
jgi:hypothetical protein